jgi:hypothetical protein
VRILDLVQHKDKRIHALFKLFQNIMQSRGDRSFPLPEYCDDSLVIASPAQPVNLIPVDKSHV